MAPPIRTKTKRPPGIDISDSSDRIGFDYRDVLLAHRINVSENPFHTPPRGKASGLQPDAITALTNALQERSVVVLGGPGTGKFRLGEDLDAWVHDPTQPERALMNPAQWPLEQLKSKNPCAVIQALRVVAESALSQVQLPDGCAAEALEKIRGLAAADGAETANRVMAELLDNLNAIANATNRLLIFQLKDADALGRAHLGMLKAFLKRAADRNVPVRLVISGNEEVAAQLHGVDADEVPLAEIELNAATAASDRAAAVRYIVDLTSEPNAVTSRVIPFTETAAGFLFDRAAGIHALINEIGWVAWERAAHEGRATVEPADVQAAERSVRSSFAWLGALAKVSRVDLRDPEAVAEIGRTAGLSQMQRDEVDVSFLGTRGFIIRDAGNQAVRGSEARIDRVVRALDGRGFGD